MRARFNVWLQDWGWLVLPVLLIIILLVTFYVSERWECSKLQGQMPDQEIKWTGFKTGCRIKIDTGLWIDVDNMHLIGNGGGR